MSSFFDSSRSTDAFVYPPARAGKVALQEYERRRTADIKLNWGVPCLDNYLLPMMRGDLVSIVGRPGNGKTSVMVHLARALSETLKDTENGVVVYATWETMVEEFVAILSYPHTGYSMEQIGRGEVETSRMEDGMAAMMMSRLVILGNSLGCEGDERPTAVRVPTLDTLEDALTELKERRYDVRAVLVDYLQRIPGSTTKDRSLLVSENLDRLKDMAVSRKIPFAVGVQSKREVDDIRGIQMPGLNDGQWSSNIEQTSDKVIAITRPSLYMDEGKEVTVQGNQISISWTTVLMKVLKQRWGRSGKIFCLDMDPRECELKESEYAEITELEQPF